VSKNLKILFIALLALAVAAPAMAATFKVQGDLHNRFKLYTDQQSWFGNDSGNQTLDDQDRPDSYGEIKYRMWTTASTNDGAVKGVVALEIGGIRFGTSDGGDFSGDGTRFETRWAYTDFQLPNVDSKARFRIGLFGHKVNKFFWAETAMGVKFYTDNWYLAWMRGIDSETGSGEDWRDGDLDSLNVRYDLKAEPVKAGFFATYFTGKTSASFVDISTFNPLALYQVKRLPESNFDLLALGIDGSWSTATNNGKLFINWDVIFETGTIEDLSDDGGVTKDDFDIAAYLVHADVGLNFGKTTLTWTVYYASGDDNNSDTDLDGFIQVDVDANYSAIFQETYTNDDYFSERHVIADKGMFLNKLDLNHKLSKKTKIGAAVLYLLTAEDIEWTDGVTDFKDDELGIEVQAYVVHKLYKNLELAWNIAYLAAGDAMDAFETSSTQNGSSDVDIFQSAGHVRYKF
jgi:hypothetical protein